MDTELRTCRSGMELRGKTWRKESQDEGLFGPWRNSLLPFVRDQASRVRNLIWNMPWYRCYVILVRSYDRLEAACLSWIKSTRVMKSCGMSLKKTGYFGLRRDSLCSGIEQATSLVREELSLESALAPWPRRTHPLV
jgi:hypothetical protein